jgi:MFS family permease
MLLTLHAATAVPTITTHFGSPEDVGWYGSAYLLTQTAFQPFFGKVYGNFNVKPAFMWGLGVFELGSVLCATARSSARLIVGRAVAGVGASALYAGGMEILVILIPLRKRAAFLALLMSMQGVAMVAAPPLGGVLTHRLSWRWW